MTNNDRLRTENEYQKQAFEFYYGLGWRRRYGSVARKYDVSVSTIKNWSKWFQWQQRVEKLDVETTKALTDQNRTNAVEQLERDLKTLEFMIRTGIKAVLDGRSKVLPKDILQAMQILQRKIEKAQEEAEVENRSASTHHILLMPDNGRDDCSLPRQLTEQDEEDGDELSENKQPESEGNNAGHTEAP